MDDIYKLYEQKFSKSKALYEKAKSLFPNGICHDIRSYPPFPVVTDRCEDIYMYDTNGNRLLDLWMGHFALLLGHGSITQNAGAERGLEAGIHHGTLNTMQIEFAETLKSAVPELELMRLCTSGTEATMYVTRVARAFTRRDVIVKVEGGWHGGNSVLSNGVVPPFVKRENAPEGLKTVSVPYNNTERTLDILNEYKDDTAAIILEPMLGAGGGILADEEYLKAIRQFCDETGTLLIFDEVVTGFRFRYGSIWPLLGVQPDLFTFGKATAGGMHVGIYGGRRDVMETISKQKLFAGGGTYSGNPLSMAVGIQTLNKLKTMDYNSLNIAGDGIRQFLESKVQNLKVPAAATGYGSYFCLHFLTDRPETVTPAILMSSSDKDMENLFKAAMLVNNVFTVHSGGALSFMHMKSSTIDTIKQAYIKTFEMLEI